MLDSAGFTTGKIFLVSAAASGNRAWTSGVFQTDVQGIARLHATPTLALAQCVAGRGDVLYLDPAWTTAFTAAEQLSCETKGVTVLVAGTTQVGTHLFRVYRAAATLPASTSTAYFTISGRVAVKRILGTVTTAVQAQATTAKLTNVPTLAGFSSTDLCATVDLTGAILGTTLNITGTPANAMIASVASAAVSQASELVLQDGSLKLVTVATSTGATKWFLDYTPIDPGSFVVAA